MRALNRPESWWGWHGYSQPQALSITRIIQAGTFTPRIAALLWLAVERGRSFILAADPPGAGKTTILTALLAFARPDASVYFTRGWGETFDLPPPEPGGAPIYLLVNEMSDHLPVYSWGPYVQETFALARKGYAFASTMHADTVDGVIEQLMEECDVPESDIGQLAFVVPIFVGAHGATRLRRVLEVGVLEPLGPGYDRHTVARWEPDGDRFVVLATPAEINAAARRLGMEEEELLREMERREAFLAGLIDGGCFGIDEVQGRVSRFMGYEDAGGDPRGA